MAHRIAAEIPGSRESLFSALGWPLTLRVTQDASGGRS